MDIADIGNDTAEKNLEDRIAKVRKDARTKLFPITGRCYNIKCGDDSPGRPFCSIECRDEYDLMNRKR